MDSSNGSQLWLRFEPQAAAAPSLEQQLQQLLRERGALRNVTQQSLRKEISHKASSDTEADFENDGKVTGKIDGESLQARQERIWKAREEILQKLAYAQNEVLSALDFVSLLLSGNSTAAQNSMSPALKQHVPTGTIDSHVVVQADTSTVALQKLTRVSDGWKSDSFQSACTKFNQAAGRLSIEAQRQNRYWNQIAAFKSHGWSVSRLPSDSRAISVHYGFSEAAPQFRKRGIAILQQDDMGDLLLDSRTIPEACTVTRVSIVRMGVETGSYQLRTTSKYQRDKIEEQLCKARDAIFEEELFHEIYREARLIANQDVRTRSRRVEATIDKQTSLRVSEMRLSELEHPRSKGSDDDMAEILGLSLRLLLLLEHKRSKDERSRPPPVMSHTPRTTPEYALLRPLLAHLRQQAALSALHKASQSLVQICSRAGLQLTSGITSMPGPEALDPFQRLRQPVRSTIVSSLGNGRKIQLEVETYLGSPLYGTVIRSNNLDFGFVTLQADSFNTADEAVEYLAHALTLELISQTKAFEVTRPHSGEVMIRGTSKTMAAVSVRPQRISLLVTSPTNVMHVWRLSGYQCTPDSSERPSTTFNDVVARIEE